MRTFFSFQRIKIADQKFEAPRIWDKSEGNKRPKTWCSENEIEENLNELC